MAKVAPDLSERDEAFPTMATDEALQWSSDVRAVARVLRSAGMNASEFLRAAQAAY